MLENRIKQIVKTRRVQRAQVEAVPVVTTDAGGANVTNRMQAACKHHSRRRIRNRKRKPEAPSRKPEASCQR